jgi:hypothetical protein
MNKQIWYWLIVILTIVALVFITRQVYASDFSDTVEPVSSGGPAQRAAIQAEGEKAFHQAKWDFPATVGRLPPLASQRTRAEVQAEIASAPHELHEPR